LDGAVETTLFYTDHASLVYLSSQKLPWKRLVRWLDEFSEMDIDVCYKKGAENVVPDALSRRSDLLFIDTITMALHDSDWPLIIPYLREDRPVPDFVTLAQKAHAKASDSLFAYDIEAETLLYLGRPGLEERSPFIAHGFRYALLQQVHDESGHRGRDATLCLLRGRGWWPHRLCDVKDYVRTCSQC
jgi:hypothetical protein